MNAIAPLSAADPARLQHRVVACQHCIGSEKLFRHGKRHFSVGPFGKLGCIERWPEELRRGALRDAVPLRDIEVSALLSADTAFDQAH
jgi:hypothetical protein